jgi:hypothetical protein
MRSLTVFIQDSHEIGHSEIVFVHSGRRGADNMTTEYIGKTEKFLRQNKFKIKEELFRDRSNISDVKMIESGIDFALLFSTGDKRAYSIKKILEAYEVPFRLIESD